MFENLDEKELHIVIDAMEVCKYKKGDVVIEQVPQVAAAFRAGDLAAPANERGTAGTPGRPSKTGPRARRYLPAGGADAGGADAGGAAPPPLSAASASIA